MESGRRQGRREVAMVGQGGRMGGGGGEENSREGGEGEERGREGKKEGGREGRKEKGRESRKEEGRKGVVGTRGTTKEAADSEKLPRPLYLLYHFAIIYSCYVLSLENNILSLKYKEF